MEKIRELLRLRFDCGLNHHNSADLLEVSKTWIFECLLRFKESGLSWPLPVAMSDVEFRQRLYPERDKNSPALADQNSALEQIISPGNYPQDYKNNGCYLEAR